MTPPHLVAVLVPNGLGHARRTLGILARYLARGGTAQLEVVGEPYQERAAARWPEGRRLAEAGARWHHGVAAPGVAWDPTLGTLRDGRLVAWEERLAALASVATADVVLSDNLAGTLSVRPDALLLGSFLWSDVFEAALGSPGATSPDPVAEFVAHERRLLAAHRPEMLCVAGLAMPGVLARTRPHPVGWMCPGGGRELPPTPREEVVVLGGGTGAADEVLASAAAALAASGWQVRAPRALAERAGVAPFDPASGGWAHAAAVVCRAGAGTVTDAIDWSAPIVCVDEGTNAELRHNAGRVEALGLGVDAGPSAPPEDVVAAVAAVVEPARAAAIRDRMVALERDGLDQAAEWLALHCGVLLGPRPAAGERVGQP